MLFLYFGYFSANPLMSEPVSWRWTDSYQKWGYIPCTIKTAHTTAHYITKPAGYSKETLNDIVIKRTRFSNEQPDIVLILNETFYDLSHVMDIETDIPYMENINSMQENTIKGYAVHPSRSTNGSEYELLTSNSLKLLPSITPYNIMDLDKSNSIVSHLNQLGYYTTGAHCASPVNYNRQKAYSALGFDAIHFEEDFSNITYFGERTQATDECSYKNVLSWLKQKNNSPQFVFLLTIQNHGDWNSNKPELDSVHALNDFGEYNEQINEYLSCIHLSDIAFKDFIEQLKDYDRDIIVCMVGDHGPTLANKILGDSKSDKEFLLRTSVPFIIWANYDIEDTSQINNKTISMNYLVPSLLDIAGVKLSPYYQYMLNLKSNIPILSPFQIYCDTDGNHYQYDSVSDYSELVNAYFYLEYNNLQKTRNQKLFDAYSD